MVEVDNHGKLTRLQLDGQTELTPITDNFSHDYICGAPVKQANNIVTFTGFEEFLQAPDQQKFGNLALVF
jgi:hypothetical protein